VTPNFLDIIIARLKNQVANIPFYLESRNTDRNWCLFLLDRDIDTCNFLFSGDSREVVL